MYILNCNKNNTKLNVLYKIERPENHGKGLIIGANITAYKNNAEFNY